MTEVSEVDEYANITKKLTEDLSLIAPNVHLCVIGKGDKMSDKIQEITDHYQKSSAVVISAKGAAVQKMVSVIEISKKSLNDRDLKQLNKLELVLEEATMVKPEEKILNEIANTKKVLKRPVMSVLLANKSIDTTLLQESEWNGN